MVCHYIICVDGIGYFVVIEIFFSQSVYFTTLSVNFGNYFIFAVKPLIHPFSFGEVPSNLGDVAQLNCFAIKGDAPITFSWIFRGFATDVAMPDGITITKVGDRVSLLMINSVMPKHRGNFTCHVTNSAGKDEHTTQLIVNGM